MKSRIEKDELLFWIAGLNLLIFGKTILTFVFHRLLQLAKLVIRRIFIG